MQDQPIGTATRGRTSRRPKVFVSERYGRLVVLREVEYSTGPRRFECLCDCGRQVVVRSNKLRGGTTKSCGCLKLELTASMGRANKGRAMSHGLSKSNAYGSWVAMKSRCSNPNVHGYHNWGGRGISPCASMLTFEGFFATLGERPEGLSVDRIDNDGGYWCGNCIDCREHDWPMNVRWADALTQRNNQRERVG